MKQVIVLRKDLNMRKGKMVAQGAHASMKVTLDNLNDDRVKIWLADSFTKICVSVDSEQELLQIYNEALKYNVPTCLILDNGTTEFKKVKTFTAVAVGPDTNDAVDSITGHLPLL